MIPQITRWADFAYVSEEFDSVTHGYQYIMFAVINSNDVIYYGELPTRKAEISVQQVTATPKPTPDSEIFPEFKSSSSDPTFPDMMCINDTTSYTCFPKAFWRKPVLWNFFPHTYILISSGITAAAAREAT